jgi:C-terminal processing protease CtpA/Prc
MTPIGYEIIGGMNGARAVTTHTCAYREPFSEPPRFGQGFSLSITPGGPFAYAGKVAVVIDGLALSAADYFAIGVRAATDVPLVGTPAAGAFGGGGGADFTISSDPETEGAGDVYRCVDGAGLPLEGRPAQPTHLVELDPGDLAQGIDTQLEAAVRLVR